MKTVALIIALAVLVMGGCRRARSVEIPAQIILSGRAMGSNWSVKLDRLPVGRTTESLQVGVADLIERLEQQMSNYRPGSDLSRFNRNLSTEWIGVPRELAEVMSIGQGVSEQTDGAFDVTVAPLVDVWGFGAERRAAVPSDEAIAEARSHVGYRKLQVRREPPALRKLDAKLAIDLGAIGKGYAADKIGDYLDAAGAHDYLIAVGGELRAKGRPRRVGIETPTADVRRVFEEIELVNGSLSTSGDYRSFFEVDGKRFCHEINPKTGWPIEGRLASVTVLHASGARADAMATGLIVLGEDAGSAAATQSGVAALFILRGEGKFERKATASWLPVLTGVGGH